MLAPCSSSVTPWPALTSDHAVDRPAMPAPTTMMFMEPPDARYRTYGLAWAWQGGLVVQHGRQHAATGLSRFRCVDAASAARSAPGAVLPEPLRSLRLASRSGLDLLLGRIRPLVFWRLRRGKPPAARPPLRQAESRRHSRQPRRRRRSLSSQKLRRGRGE